MRATAPTGTATQSAAHAAVFSGAPDEVLDDVPPNRLGMLTVPGGRALAFPPLPWLCPRTAIEPVGGVTKRLCHLFFEPARDDHATHDHLQVYRVAGPGFGAAQLSQGTRLLSKLGGFLSKHLGARRRVGGGLPGDLILCSQSQICPPQSGRRFCLQFTAATSPTGRARPAANGAAFPRSDRGRPRRGLPHTRPNRPRPPSARH